MTKKPSTKRKSSPDADAVVSLRLPGYLNAKLNGMAIEEERPKASVIRRLLREALNLPKPNHTT